MTISRRDVLRNAALSAMLGGLTADAAQHVHHMASEDKADSGDYEPKVFQPHEWRTLDVLAELIVPGARNGGAKEFIDLLASANDELAALYTGGLAWLDRQSEDRFSAAFAGATPAQQTELLDLIAYRKNETPELAAGIHFFDWARKMIVDAYYTSAAGIKELGYQGNVGMTDFQVPQEAIDHARKRAGFLD